MATPKHLDSTAVHGPLLLLRGTAAKALEPARHERLLARLGQSVRVLRRARSLSIAKLAQISGIDVATIMALEEGKRDCGIGVLCTLEKSLGASAGFIVRASSFNWDS